MSRATVRKVFVTGLVVFVVGVVITILTASGGRSPDATLNTIGVMLGAFGVLIVFVSWILALISAAVLGSWGWFIVTLILGLIGLLPLVMIVYSLLGPSRPRVARPMVA
jgi:flagellar biosynthesis protein FliQ